MASGRRPTLDPLDWALATTVTLLTLMFLATLLPNVEVRGFAPGLDLAFDTITTLVALAVAGLAWMRYRELGQPAALFQTAAFSLLAVARAMAAILALWSLDFASTTSPARLEPNALAVSTVACLACGALLVAGGRASVGRLARGRSAVVVILPIGMLVVLAVSAPLWVTLMPPLIDRPVTVTQESVTVLPGPTSANVLVQGIGAALFASAAAMYLGRHRRERSVADRYLAVGLFVAAFAQLHLALYPSAYPGVLTSGDLLYLVFDLLLLLGILAETKAYVSGLRRANLRLGLMRDAEMERAAMEERARLSRELHDGLAQDLWLAKLKAGRLAALPGLGGEAGQLCSELGNAIDSGLADARQAVMALRVVAGPDQSFSDLLGRYVDDFADRFGIRAEFECEPGLPRLATRVEAELLRIAQEALSNVRRHADATVVWVHVGIDEGRVKMTVLDNGRGFDPRAVEGSGYGLTGMHERASIIGARLSVVSRPSDGTLVSVDVAVGAGAQGLTA